MGNTMQQIREFLRCPTAILSLHLVDGVLLNDGQSLGNLSISYQVQLYCSLHTEVPTTTPEQINSAAGAPEFPVAEARAAAEVCEQIYQSEKIWGVSTDPRGSWVEWAEVKGVVV